MPIKTIGAPQGYQNLCTLLKDSAVDATLNFSLRDPTDAQHILNPPAILRLLKDKTRLYPWLLRRGYATLPLVRARREGSWPLWAIQNAPKLCADATEALATTAELFIAAEPPYRQHLWRCWCVAGKIIYTALSSDGTDWKTAADTPPRCQELLYEINRLYGAELFIAYLLEDAAGGFSVLDLSLPQAIPETFCSTIAKLLAEHADELMASKYLPLWQIVALCEPIIICSYPPTSSPLWHWSLAKKEATESSDDEITPRRKRKLRHSNYLRLITKENTASPQGISAVLKMLQEYDYEEMREYLPVAEPDEPERLMLHPEEYRRQALLNLKKLSDYAYEVRHPGIRWLHTLYRNIQASLWIMPRQDFSHHVLGILSLPPRKNGEPFAFESLHFKQLAQLAPAYGLQVVVFAANDLKATSKRCWGYIWRDSAWKRGCFPLPEVVYLRGVTLDELQLDERAKALRLLKRNHIPLLNNIAFMEVTGDKALFDQTLRSFSAGEYLPETMPYSAGNLQTMLRNHDLLFIKPKYGYEARGILRIQRQDEQYDCTYNSPEGQLQKWRLEPGELEQRLRELPLHQGYLIQQGIHPATWQDNIFELRLIMQREGSSWACLGKVIRLTGRNDLPMVTALRERWQATEVVLEDCFPGKSKAIAGQAEKIALELCDFFSQPPYEAMEFALDFLLDAAGKLWILEANAKPASFFVQIGDDEARRRSLAAKLKHARWVITNNKNKSGG